MEYNEKMKKLQEEIKSLRNLRKKELLAKYQYLVGKCFQNGKNEIFKIKKVDYVYDYDDYTFKVNCIVVMVRFGYGKSDLIDFNYTVDVDINDFVEVSNNEFGILINKVSESMLASQVS